MLPLAEASVDTAFAASQIDIKTACAATELLHQRLLLLLTNAMQQCNVRKT